MKNFIDELTWRGMIHDKMPGIEEELAKGMTAGYIGFDPTADSLHIGNLVPVMILVHFQRAGHKPYALVGGATGMVGDPSGKSEERNLLDKDALQHNLSCQRKQLEKFLNFDCGDNSAVIVNNYDWFKDFTFLDFIRDVGKHITVNYMMAKDSVKNRLENGMSFTEFSYQLVQGYDFFHLNKEFNCKVQMGGSDQWGNIVTGTELIRRMGGSDAYAVTTPLLKKSDGKKFGKSEKGNIWLDADRTSPYEFYQYWLKVSDEDAANYIKVFTLKTQEEIEALIEEHQKDPSKWLLQKALADDVTIRVHGEEELKNAMNVSELLFGKGTEEQLRALSDDELLGLFRGVSQSKIERSKINEGVNVVDFLAEAATEIYPSKGDIRRNFKGNAIGLNKKKVKDDKLVGEEDLINDRYLLVQKGKKTFHLVVVE